VIRAARLVLGVLATFAVRVLARTRPQRWCPPALSLRLFRWSSEPGTALTADHVRRFVPDGGRTVRRDLAYRPDAGRDGLLDLVLPDRPGPHPWLLWAHGGGWHFGSKDDVLPYVELLARRGVAGAVVNYPRAPRAAHPAAPDAVRAALAHLRAHADDLGLDPDRVVLAGDSAGAQVAAEVVAADPAAFRGALLFCGIYDPAALDDSDRMFEAVLESAMWSVARSRRWPDSAACRAMTVLDHVTPAFPPTFLASGDADPLTRRQTPPMAARLRELGVPLEEYVGGTAGEPAGHEFQFRLETAAAQQALERAAAFLERVLDGPSISH
jgi:acetyl esterase/lipase